MVKKLPIETMIAGPYFLGRVLGMSEITYQMRPAKSTTSAPQVKWCEASRFLSDATLPPAPKSVTSSKGQHQLPKMLGRAMQMVVASVTVPEAAEAVFSGGGAGPQFPLSQLPAASTNGLVSDGSSFPLAQRCINIIPPSIKPPVTAPVAV